MPPRLSDDSRLCVHREANAADLVCARVNAGGGNADSAQLASASSSPSAAVLQGMFAAQDGSRESEPGR